MIGRALAYYSSLRISLVFFYLLLVSLRLLEVQRKSQDTSYYGPVSIARLFIKRPVVSPFVTVLQTQAQH